MPVLVQALTESESAQTSHAPGDEHSLMLLGPRVRFKAGVVSASSRRRLRRVGTSC